MPHNARVLAKITAQSKQLEVASHGLDVQMPKIIASTFVRRDSVAGGGAGAAIIVAIIVGLIYFGRDVLLPIALAVLLSFVLAPLVRTLQNWWIARGFSVIAVVLLTFLALFAIGGTIAMEATQLVS